MHTYIHTYILPQTLHWRGISDGVTHIKEFLNRQVTQSEATNKTMKHIMRSTLNAYKRLFIMAPHPRKNGQNSADTSPQSPEKSLNTVFSARTSSDAESKWQSIANMGSSLNANMGSSSWCANSSPDGGGCVVGEDDALSQKMVKHLKDSCGLGALMKRMDEVGWRKSASRKESKKTLLR